VYKVEKYLDACVRSVLSQSFNDLELILVDDGSPDGCGALCNAWAARDGRVVAVHQPNSGLAAARNTGLDRRRGKYVAFVDSDDTLPPRALEMLYAKAEQGSYDIVTAGTTVIYGHYAREWVCPAFDAPEPAALRPHIEAYFFSMLAIIHPAGKLILGELADRFGVRFDPALPISEDTDFYCRLFSHARRIANLDVPLYNYMKRAEHSTITGGPRLDGVENARTIKRGIVTMLRAMGFAGEAGAYEADPARMSGYATYFNQLNHAGLRIPFAEHRRRLRELLADPVARGVVLKELGRGGGHRSAAAARLSAFWVRRRRAGALTCFIRLKAAIIRCRGGRGEDG
jgi:glycosyltransferase involved in cell wall biosynthesis